MQQPQSRVLLLFGLNTSSPSLMFELQHLISADFCQVLPWKLICVHSLITLADVTSITDELRTG